MEKQWKCIKINHRSGVTRSFGTRPKHLRRPFAVSEEGFAPQELGDEEAPLGDASSRKIDEAQAKELEKDRFRSLSLALRCFWQLFRWALKGSEAYFGGVSGRSGSSSTSRAFRCPRSRATSIKAY